MVFEYFSDIDIEIFIGIITVLIGIITTLIGIITILIGIITIVILLAEFDISQLPIIHISKTEIQLKLNPITEKDEKLVNLKYGIMLVKHGINTDFRRIINKDIFFVGE